MPKIALAGRDKIDVVAPIMDSQVQGIGAWAVVVVGIVVGVFSCGVVFVAMPCVALAGGFGIGIVGAVEDNQVQGRNFSCRAS